MNFKVGDLVVPKRNLIEGRVYGGLTLYEGMKKELFSCPCWTIENVRTHTDGTADIEVEGSAFTYTSEMLEPLLSVGKIVQLSDDSLAFVAESTHGLCISGPEHWFPLDCLDKNLSYKNIASLYIKKVYGLSAGNINAWKLETTDRKCIWEREKPAKEMTVKEIEEKLGYSIKVIKEEEF